MIISYDIFFCFFLNRENIQGTRLLIDGLKYRLKLVIPYANTWEQVKLIILLRFLTIFLYRH